jgi:hypothetical protein
MTVEFNLEAPLRRLVGILAGPNAEEQSKEPGKIVMKILYLPTRL